MFLKGLAAGAIFIAVELTAEELKLKLKGLGAPESAVRELALVLSAIAVTTAIWLTSKLINVLVRTERAREALEMRAMCKSLRGRDIHELMSVRTELGV